MKEMIILEQQMPKISINFDELKKDLAVEIDKYKGLVVTEETLPTCKATQKELAGLRIKIDNARKEIKQEVEKPIKQFEAKVKELLIMIEAVEKPIKDGVKFYDDIKRQEKAELVENIKAEYITKYELIPDVAKMIQINESLFNLTTNEKQIRDNLSTQCINLVNIQQSYQNGLKMITEQIKTFNSLYTLKLPLNDSDFRFRVGYDISLVMNQIKSEAEKRSKMEKDLEEHDRMIAESKKQVPVIPVISILSSTETDDDFGDFDDLFDDTEEIVEIRILIRQSEFEHVSGILKENEIIFEVL